MKEKFDRQGYDNIVISFSDADKMTETIHYAETISFKPQQIFCVGSEVWCVFFYSPAHEDLQATGDAIDELRKKLDLPEGFGE